MNTTTTALDWPTIFTQASAFVTTEYASLTRAHEPVTWPVTPYAGDNGRTIDVSTGLTYPLKAERARRNPKVALSFTYPTGSGLDDAASFVVLGEATVRDADLVAGSARYLRVSSERFPEAMGRVPSFVLRRMAFYWTRQWIEVTPVRVLWWDGGDLDEPPQEWHAPEDFVAPPSDPGPAGRVSGSWSTKPAPDWRTRTHGAIGRLGPPVLTAVTADGWPLPVRVRDAVETSDGYVVVPPSGVRIEDGPAFVTFHTHAAAFDGQENIGLAGRCVTRGDEVHVTIDRSLNDWGVPRNPLRNAVSMMRAGRRLRPRLVAEAARRGQRLPTFDQLDLG